LSSTEYALFKMIGTTFSGHPTLTTLGNTLRSICYAEYAAFMANVPVKLLAAGDDVVAFLHKDHVAIFIESMKTNVSTHDKTLPSHGLG